MTSPPHHHAILREWLARRIAAVGVNRRVGATDNRLDRLAGDLPGAWGSPVLVLVDAADEGNFNLGSFRRGR